MTSFSPVTRRLVAGLWLTTLAAAPAGAQPAAPSTSPASPGCAGTQLQQRETPSPTPQLRDNAGGNLSDKLAQSDGVICPPQAVDPAIKAPTPSTGDSSVVAPPGSPGGDPTVRPK
jgi:hypothetical protein